MNLKPSTVPLLLLLDLLNFWQLGRGYAYRVGLTIQPSTTVQSGTPVKIICQVNISYSNTWNFTHTFQIRQNDAPVYSSTTKEDTVVYELNPARRADSGNYECRVTVKEISKLSNTQKLIITGLQTPILYVNNTAPYENEEFTAVCSAPEEKGSLIFHFYQRFTNGESQPIKQLAPSVNSAETMLVLSPLGDRLLSCDYEINRISGRSNRSNEISVLVKGLQIVPIMNVLPSSEVYEGDTMKFSCSIVIYVPERINKDTIKYSYYKDNMIVASSRTYNSTTQLSQIGNYTCEVLALSQNHSFVKKSELFVLNPKVRVAEAVMSVVGGTLVLGKHFQVLCHSDNGSLPITYTLSSPSSPAKIREVKNPGEQAIFNVSALYKASDIRKLYCSAQNSKHIPVKTHTLHYTNIIEPVSKPVLKILPNMGDVTEGQDVMLVCSVQKGTTPIVFSWHHTNEGGPLTFLTSDKLEASFNITNVRAKHQRAYYCVSTNRAHETKQSQEVSIRVKTAGWKKGLIAASCILTLIVLILVIICRKHLLWFKRRTTKELSVKPAGTKVERLSLTQAEVNQDANESDDQHSVASPEKPEPQYTEVHIRQADPDRAPVAKGTDTVYSEVRTSEQGTPEEADGNTAVCQGQDGGFPGQNCKTNGTGVYSKGSRYSSTQRTQTRESPAPVIPVTPAKRSVHFPNDIVFQDIVRRGDMEQIGRFMRARKVRIDTLFHSGMAALHEAVLTGNLEVVKLLVKYGADVHQKDEDGWTPLHMACSDSYPEIARYLLSKGASTEAENESGEKPADLIDPDCKELVKLFE
ncbi:unnamed protein product, partial [Tetraodon nigroviridis]